jgi:ribonuclease P protein subunit POP4
VIQETAGTFKLVGKDDLIRGSFSRETTCTLHRLISFPTVIPKANSLFLLSFPAYHFSSLPNAPQSDPEVSSIPPLPPIDPSDPLSFLSSPDPEPSLARSQYEAFEQTLKEVAKIEIDILGSAFAFRSSDRVGRKFKFGGVLDQGWSEEWLLPEVLGDI